VASKTDIERKVDNGEFCLWFACPGCSCVLASCEMEQIIVTWCPWCGRYELSQFIPTWRQC